MSQLTANQVTSLCFSPIHCHAHAACGVKFNLTIQVAPFLLLGLGMDDTFVLIGTYFQQVGLAEACCKHLLSVFKMPIAATASLIDEDSHSSFLFQSGQDRRLSVRDRIAGCLAAGGTSITVTSLTDFIAFIIGYW